MTPSLRRVVSGAAVLLVAFASSMTAARAQTPTTTQQTSSTPWGSWTQPTDDGTTSANGIFAGEFDYAGIGRVDLSLTLTTPTDKVPTACPQFPTDTQNTTDGTFSFDESAKICNGTYDVVATAYPRTTSVNPNPQPYPGTLKLTDISVAVRPAPPTSVTATPNGQDVDVSWTPVEQPPAPDLQYLVYRSDELDPIAPPQTDTTYHDSDVPGGGPYTYTVMATRGDERAESDKSNPVTFAAPTNASVSSGTPAHATPAPATGGRGITITPGTMPMQPAGTALFDQLGGDDVEPGDPNASIPADPTAQAAATTQHYRSGPPGAALLKPFAAALVLGVWALLLLYVSRQAKRLDAAVAPAMSPIRLEELP